MTKLSILVLGLPLVAGCHATIFGNLAVLAVTVGVFYGTLNLGRGSAATSRADTSTTTRR